MKIYAVFYDGYEFAPKNCITKCTPVRFFEIFRRFSYCEEENASHGISHENGIGKWVREPPCQKCGIRATIGCVVENRLGGPFSGVLKARGDTAWGRFYVSVSVIKEANAANSYPSVGGVSG